MHDWGSARHLAVISTCEYLSASRLEPCPLDVLGASVLESLLES